MRIATLWMGLACVSSVAHAQWGMPAMPNQGPTHPPTPAAQWPQLEARAKEAALSGGGKFVTAFRLTSADMAGKQHPCVVMFGATPKIFCVARPLKVEARTCYTVGVAWGYASKAKVDVMFGKGVNDSLAGKPFESAPPVASDTFCTDHAGEVSVQVSAMTAQRIMINDELLEYAVAVSSRGESAQGAAARKAGDAAKAEDALRTMETNIYNSELRERGEAFARSCDRCRRSSGLCKKNGGAADDCRLQFETCAQAVGTDRYGRVLCNPGVR
jgi:hypothetical protein